MDIRSSFYLIAPITKYVICKQYFKKQLQNMYYLYFDIVIFVFLSMHTRAMCSTLFYYSKTSLNRYND